MKHTEEFFLVVILSIFGISALEIVGDKKVGKY